MSTEYKTFKRIDENGEFNFIILAKHWNRNIWPYLINKHYSIFIITEIIQSKADSTTLKLRNVRVNSVKVFYASYASAKAAAEGSVNEPSTTTMTIPKKNLGDEYISDSEEDEWLLDSPPSSSDSDDLPDVPPCI